MSASTDPGRDRLPPAGPAPRGLSAAAWRGGGLLYLAACLAGLAAGLYPEAIYPSRRDVVPAPLPTLQALAVAQVLFVLLGQPLLVLRRAERGQVGNYWAEAVVESLTWLAATVPLYVAAAWLADAVAADVLRSVFYLLCVWPFGWAAGALLLREGPARAVVLLGLLCVAVVPAAGYIVREFMPLAGWRRLWWAGPATAAWSASASRGAGLLAGPAWSVLLWPAGALVLGGLSVVFRRRR